MSDEKPEIEDSEEPMSTTAVVPMEDAPKGPPSATSVLALRIGRKGPELKTIDEAVKYATACHRSGLLKHIATAQQAYAIMDNGRELGLAPWASWKLIYITKQGRIAIVSKGALAICQASPVYESYTERVEYEGTEEMTAVAIAKRRGQAKPVEKRFSLADAEKAGLLSKKRDRRGEEYEGPWQSFVKDMLQARARDRALSVAFADVLAGIEPETIAEDADRLEARAAGVPPAQSVSLPKDVDPGSVLDEAAPAKLPAAKPDPLMAFVMKGQRAQAAVDSIVETAKEKEAAASAAISASVDEALPARPRVKIGDTIATGTRIVEEVDDDGRPTVVRKATRKEMEAWRAAQRPAAAAAPAAAPAPVPPAEPAAAPAPTPAPQAAGKDCPREGCGAPLNLLGDCDACGWPRHKFD